MYFFSVFERSSLSMGSKFSSEFRQMCTDVMDALMSHPIAKPFLNDDNAEDSTDASKKGELSFSKIKNKLMSSEYSKVKQWETDMNMFFDQIRNSDISPHCSIVADELSMIFKKKMPSQSKQKDKSWAGSVAKIFKTIDSLSPPPLIIAYTPSSVMNEKFQNKPLNEEDIKTFVRISKYFTSEEDLRAISSLLKSKEPQIPIDKENVEIDISDISDDTFVALRLFFAERLAQMNIKYPRKTGV